ncbi:MAG: TadE family protein [Blautia sp.]|nr:TadE family protein [Blautia sp.]
MKIRKGSMTVEAACLMPLILLVLMGVLYLNFFVHNRSWLTSAAYEAAVSAGMEGIKTEGKVYETAKMKSEELGNIGFFGAENLTSQTNAGDQVQVTYDLDTISGFGGISWHLHTEGKSKIINPVKYIRNFRQAASILKGGEN